MQTRQSLRIVGAIYLILQSLCAALWWAILWMVPSSRHYFRPESAPDAVLLSFLLPDTLLFIGAALWAARNLLRQPQGAIIPLALHTGAAVFAALYCLMQWMLTGEAFLAALFMAPCLFIGPCLLWKLAND